MPIVGERNNILWRKTMGMSVRPVSIGKSTYLPVPRDVAELLRVMASKICSVNFKINEKECQLIYSFAKQVPDLKEEPADPSLVLAG
ncbi:MAG TPA: hypothetical protein VE955_10485 [Candidatus Dormibacteraeota bacterium]|jgi:hypothetical protein|nr:hypothetical protein [Candidatus Dormibacteraeota bacterium]